MQVLNGAWLAVGFAAGLALGEALAPFHLGSRDAVDAMGRKIPERYLPKAGPARSRRIEQIGQRRDEYRKAHQEGREPSGAEQGKLFRDFTTDRGATGKTSTYVRVARARGLTGDPNTGARAASKLYGAPIDASVLRAAYERGLAAWASGGHRPGASGPQWAAARVASLLVGGKAAWTADRDLFERLPRKARRVIVQRAPEVLSELERDGRGEDAAAIRAAMEI